MERDDRIERRENPGLILPGAKSVIMVGMMYWPGATGFPASHEINLKRRRKDSTNDDVVEEARRDEEGAPRGIISSYAWGADYHKVMGKRLKQLGKHMNGVGGGIGRFYVDTGAILERDFAERAGLGFIGKNSLLINPELGSGFFIGELFSTLALPLDGDDDQGSGKEVRGKPGCGGCTLCKVHCPTGAIVEDRVVDARRCISYLSIELKGAIPLHLRRMMGSRIYGCDICQAVCPWNRRLAWDAAAAAGTSEGGGFSVLFGQVGKEVTSPVLSEVVQLDEEGFRTRFAGTAVARIGRARMARNAAVGLGNVGGAEAVGVLRRVARCDEDAMVREHAQWAVDEIGRRIGGIQ